MGWLIATIVLPLLFTLLAVYTVVKVALLLVRIAFVALTLRRQ